jgi:hypothetical protein
MALRGLIILVSGDILLVALGVGAYIYAPKIKDGLKIKGIRRLVHLGLTMGIIGLVYAFFAWQGVALLAARFWLLIWGITLLIWALFIAKYLFSDVPRLRRQIENKRKFDKYIP